MFSFTLYIVPIFVHTCFCSLTEWSKKTNYWDSIRTVSVTYQYNSQLDKTSEFYFEPNFKMS